MTATFSWNLIADIRQMWALPFMLNAFRAGTIVAILAAVVGWFMVLRRQTFAGHSLALVGFPGAAAAVWLGLNAVAGYVTFALIAALLIAAAPANGRSRHSEESALVGTVQAFALASGMLFLALYGGFLNTTNALLFGSFLGITADQVTILAAAGVTVLTTLAIIGRPLLFASVDADVACARGVPTRALGTAFMLLLAATTAEVSQITGALLVFALLVLPAATAQVLNPRPVISLVVSVVLGLMTVWFALFVAYYSPYPVGFWLTSTAFASYVLVAAAQTATTRIRSRPGRPAPVRAPA